MNFEDTTRIARPKVLKLARQGRLIDESFKVFQRAAYPDAPQHQVAEMRVAFFAGAQELLSLMMVGAEEGTEETPGDMAFMDNIATELETFYRQVIAAANPPQGNA